MKTSSPKNKDSHWEELTKNITPLKKDDDDDDFSLPDSRVKITIKKQTFIKTESSFKNKPLREIDLGDTKDLTKKTAQKFIKGEMQIEALLDMHGLNENEAYLRLEKFIIENYQKKHRCLLVITGKGKDGNSILKQMTPKWLKEDKLRNKIISFCYAPQNKGGEGAIYILLKQIKD